MSAELLSPTPITRRDPNDDTAVAPVEGSSISWAYFFLQGVSVSFVFSAMITGQNYFRRRLEGFAMAQDFLAHFTIIYMTIKFFFLLLSISIMRHFRPNLQINFSILGNLVNFIILTVISATDRLSQETFYAIVLALVLLASLCAAFGNAGFMTMLANFPPSQMQAFTLGHCMAGLVVVMINIGSYISTQNRSLEHFALFYFGASAIVALFSFIMSLLIHRNPFYRHHQELGKRNLAMTPDGSKKGSVWEVFRQVADPTIAIFITCYLGALVFPLLVLSTVSTQAHETQYHRDLFGPIAILMINVGELIGKLISLSPACLLDLGCYSLWSGLRLIFVPLLIFGNLHFNGYCLRYPQFLANDYLFMTICFTKGLTGGYLWTIMMMFAPLRVSERDRPTCSSILVFALALGLLLGAYSSWGLKRLLVAFALSDKPSPISS